MNKIKKGLMFFIVFLYLVNIVNAFNLNIEQEEDLVCGGVKKQYRGEITNDGNQRSSVHLTVRGPNWANLDKNVFPISADSSEEFVLNTNIPAHAKGFFDVVVSATIGSVPPIKLEKNLRMEVVPTYDCYKANIIADEKIINYYSNVDFPIKIINVGVKQADYEINLEGPNWISIEPKELSVNPRQSANLSLNINPDAEVSSRTYPIKINLKLDNGIVYSKNVEIVLIKAPIIKELKSSPVFYQYYIYAVLLIILVLLIFRLRTSGKMKRSHRKSRKSKYKSKRIKKHRAWILFLIGLIIIASLIFFSIYKYDFPVSKTFIRTYYGHFLAGILISLFIIFLIEFYKPLFKLLRNIDRSKKRK